MYTLIIIANFLIGICIGVCGIAGFLLPMFYTSFLGMQMSDSMAISFCAFAVSGIIGAYSYNKTKDVDIKFATRLAIGSVVGAVIGVSISKVIPVVYAKRLLYTMVLCSGISLLKAKKQGLENESIKKLKDNDIAIVMLGIIIATISSLTGAGGPVLSVPILAVMGFTVRQSVGISLFNCIFISMPAFLGYLENATMDNINQVLLLVAISHGLGIFTGAKMSSGIDPKMLKQGVGMGSALLSVYMIMNTF